MDEHSYSRAIAKKFKEFCYTWKINDNFAGGVPDFYLSGSSCDLWLEVKYIKLPKRHDTVLRYGLSKLQTSWLKKRHAEGRKVAVLVGADDNTSVLFSGLSWELPLTKNQFNILAVKRPAIIQTIKTLVAE